MNVTPIRSGVNFRNSNSTPETKHKTSVHPIALTGLLAAGFMTATAITGCMHKKNAHLVTACLTTLALTSHILALKPPKQKTLDANA